MGSGTGLFSATPNGTIVCIDLCAGFRYNLCRSENGLVVVVCTIMAAYTGRLYNIPDRPEKEGKR